MKSHETPRISSNESITSTDLVDHHLRSIRLYPSVFFISGHGITVLEETCSRDLSGRPRAQAGVTENGWVHLFSFAGHVTAMRTYIMRCYSRVFIEVAAYTLCASLSLSLSLFRDSSENTHRRVCVTTCTVVRRRRKWPHITPLSICPR